MTSKASSTIAALCYANPSNLDFAALAAELEEALRFNPMLDLRVTSQYEDFVILDLAGLRICLAFCDLHQEFPQHDALSRYRETLVIAVGSRPDLACDGPLFEKRADVFEGLVERVGNQHPAHRFMLIELEEVFTEDLYDSVLEQVWHVLQREVGEFAAPAAAETRTEAPQAPGGTGPAQPVRPTHPALAADRAGLRAMRTRPAALRQEDRAWVENTRIRMALYPPEPEEVDPKSANPLVHRAAIHAMNASVIAFSLPMGAVVLTYSILGRESLNFTARIAALTGSLMGTSQSDLGAQILGVFA